MKKLIVKQKIETLTLILLLVISALVLALPTVIAQPPPPPSGPQSIKTYCYLGAIPNPVGVNQQVLLHVGITDYLENTADGWQDMSVTIDLPDGSSDVLGPITTDSTGGTGVVYTPTMTGTYYMQAHFPEQNYTWSGMSFFSGLAGEITYEASESEILELVVDDSSIEYYPGHSLPTEYWDRPIDNQLREWWPISGSWVREPDNMIAPYNDGPETAHILWAKELDIGGLAGGELWQYSYGIGDAYEGKWGGSFGAGAPKIIAGRLYYIEGGASGDRPIVYHCVDLSTGEELWDKVFPNNQTIAFGQILYWDTYNYHGAYAYLYTQTGGASFFGPPMPGTLTAYDAYNGDWRFTINNVPAGTTLYDEFNSLYKLSVNSMSGRMTLWDMSAVGISRATSAYTAGSWGNSAHGNTFDANEVPEAYILNVTIPTGLPGSVQAAALGDKVVGGSASNEEVTLWGLSLEDGDEGDLLFQNTWDAPSSWAAGNLSVSISAVSLEDNVLVIWGQQERMFYGFSLETGEYLWAIDNPEHYMNVYYSTTTSIVDGKLYTTGAAGVVYCYDVTNGDLIWSYDSVDRYSEILWANNWWVDTLFFTDGKIYCGHEEHSPIDPRPRGAPFFALDMNTGELIFRIEGAFRQTHWGANAIIGDSIIATMNTYDQRIYAIGKGPTALTVEAPLLGAELGSTVMIRGTVTDISPGTAEYRVAARFPNGVPAVSDASISEWMKYVYMQFEQPMDTTGVTVKLEAIDPNGNYQNLGTATTDISGTYGLAFEPEVPGTYQIIATFDGSEAYYGSYQITYLTVDPAPTPSTPIEPEEPEPETPTEPEQPEEPTEPEQAAEAPLISTEVAIVAAVAIVAVIGVVAFWVLRKRG